ncbi:MAG: hypothetical protein HC906_13945 [Bacteroidales bacterium]|nr:hypothetical protein [Bacteroidales bacterium]
MMREFNIPVPGLSDDDVAEITIVVKGKTIKYEFRVETFIWGTEPELEKISDPLAKSLAKIFQLKKAIESYPKEWELVQIYNPCSDTQNIQVLYRKKINTIE